jgi:hypothetical protein
MGEEELRRQVQRVDPLLAESLQPLLAGQPPNGAAGGSIDSPAGRMLRQLELSGGEPMLPTPQLMQPGSNPA